MPSPRVADAHSDLLIEVAFAEDRLAEANPLRDRWLGSLEQGAVVLQTCAIYVEPEHLRDGRGLLRALRLAHAFHAGVRANADRAFAVTSLADLARLDDGRRGLLLSLEGADSLGEDPWLIDVLAALGVRMASPTWNGANAFAAGCGAEGGLTARGRELVDRMVANHVAVDLAHAAPRTFWDALERVPPGHALVSHAACGAVLDHPRNLGDDQLRALAEHGGVVGLMPHPLVVDEQAPTLDRFVDHVDHAVAVAGPRHVALGGDFLRQIARTIGLPDPEVGPVADAAIEGLDGPAQYPALADALTRRGYGDDDVAALFGGNLLALLARTLPAG
ncbi:MAG TPA: membrane dipeptidase [Baekduia sp.]|uniref:dipeptidase n=1 Tax=Baekduia sp. TaxID=2600305 RepID=UPI002D7918C8|nr:membrane dipeptidase [Baekduia sp.]HET6505318.1 membrane dipeptidase [Baekduia sp.]